MKYYVSVYTKCKYYDTVNGCAYNMHITYASKKKNLEHLPIIIYISLFVRLETPF